MLLYFSYRKKAEVEKIAHMSALPLRADVQTESGTQRVPQAEKTNETEGSQHYKIIVRSCSPIVLLEQGKIIIIIIFTCVALVH